MTSSGHSFSSNRIPFKGLSALVWSYSPEAILNLNACDSNHPMPQDLEREPDDASVLVQSLSQLHRLSQASHDPRESGIKATGFGLELCPAGTQPYPRPCSLSTQMDHRPHRAHVPGPSAQALGKASVHGRPCKRLPGWDQKVVRESRATSVCVVSAAQTAHLGS